jgi:Phosphotransferase enzyme family
VAIESDPSEPQAGLSPLEALPGLATAFDEEAMRAYVEEALLHGRPSYTVERCTPTRPLYMPGDSCVLRYRFQARNSASGEVLEPIVMGRVFPNRSACAVYMSDKLAPLAARMRGRPEVAAFAAPAAMIDALNMVVHVWPVDGELPTLVDATDRARMIDVFREELAKALKPPFLPEDCQIELVSYRRRQRCVLRYTVAGKTAGSDQVRKLVVYGKVSASGDKTLNSRMLDALRDRISRPAAQYRFTLPRSFGSRPDLQLMLLEALPGEAHIGPALEARLRGRPPPDAPRLEDMVATCGYVAAILHASGVELGRARTVDDELAGLLGQIASARQFAPSFGDRAHSWLKRIAALAEQSKPLTFSLCHGDFKHEQLLIDGAGSGLVDFDAMCQAEPALDLGKFLAHLRTEVQKVQRRSSAASPLGEELAEQFLGAYVSASGDHLEDERRLRLRTTVYESIALLRLALRSQHDLDEPRREMTSALLEKRISALPRTG